MEQSEREVKFKQLLDELNKAQKEKDELDTAYRNDQIKLRLEYERDVKPVEVQRKALFKKIETFWFNA